MSRRWTGRPGSAAEDRGLKKLIDRQEKRREMWSRSTNLHVQEGTGISPTRARSSSPAPSQNLEESATHFLSGPQISVPSQSLYVSHGEPSPCQQPHQQSTQRREWRTHRYNGPSTCKSPMAHHIPCGDPKARRTPKAWSMW